MFSAKNKYFRTGRAVAYAERIGFKEWLAKEAGIIVDHMWQVFHLVDDALIRAQLIKFYRGKKNV